MNNLNDFLGLECLLIKKEKIKTIKVPKPIKIKPPKVKKEPKKRLYKYTINKYYSTIKTKYNIEPEEYIALLEKQNNKCAICEKEQSEFKERLCVDHDHTTGKIRGLLCKACNISIGRLKENIFTLEKAIEYLKRSKIDIFSIN